MLKYFDVSVNFNVLVEANNEEEAIAKALQYAEQEDLSYIASTHVVETE